MTSRIVDQLSTEEKVSLLSGSDVWRTAPIERLGVPAIKVSDGPNGVRGDSTTGARAVCLPAPISLAASFDIDLVAELGGLLGRETLRKGSHVLLAPTINMARHPLGGRNFESFGEDPILTAAMAVAYVTGVQDAGVGACAKHLVANDIEDGRLTVSSEVDPATLREVYLHPFEAAVKAGVWSVMAAYPKLNGEHCSENHWLLTTLLREEWGFDGLVMSDWGATHHPSRPVLAGLDLEMPGPPLALGPKLLAAVEAGDVPMSVLDARAATVIDLAVRADRLGKTEEPERSVDLPEERELVRRAAADGMVLLTNRALGSETAGPGDSADSVLPLSPALTSLAVLGPNAAAGVIQGGGSAELISHYRVSPLEGLSAAVPDARVDYHLGCTSDRYMPEVPTAGWATEGDEPLALEVFDTPELIGEPAVTRSAKRLFAFEHGPNSNVPHAELWAQRWTGNLIVEASGTHQFGVLAVGRARVLVNGELVADNWTDPKPGHAFFEKASEEVVGSIELEAGQNAEVIVEWSSGEDDQLAGLRFGHRPPIDDDALLDEAVAAAAAADAAVVVIGLTAEWETESHDRVMFGLPGRQDELVRRVAEANPRTVVVLNAGGPVDLPWLDEVPATVVAWYPGQEFGTALAEVLFGVRDPGGRLPVTFPKRLADAPTADTVPGDGLLLHYGEELFIGHRWYSEHQIEPLVPFGHGLSYTEFAIGEPTVQADGLVPASVSVPVSNTGSRAGKCVVQAYLVPDAPGRPRTLAGFAAITLDAQASENVTLAIDPHSLRQWDVDADGWTPLVGNHQLEIGTSSTAIVHTTTVAVPTR
ncbi:MAG: glycoside hydrolase family 3 C-terminal domain-containing protein [Acidimicrobiales bacterium]